MLLTAPLLVQCGADPRYAERYAEPLNRLTNRYDVQTPLRVAHLLAQLLHESVNFRYVEEIASGAAYEGRRDLGNTQPGDGVRFKGRGLIQITGRINYAALSRYYHVDYLTHPEWLCRPEDAVLSALWYWDTHARKSLSYWADLDDLLTITRYINGGTNGLASRQANLTRIKHVFGLMA